MPGLAVEADGWTHFSMNAPFQHTLQSESRNRILKASGWREVTIPIFEWNAPEIVSRREEYLSILIIGAT